jgi:hypothetical protein
MARARCASVITGSRRSIAITPRSRRQRSVSSARQASFGSTRADGRPRLIAAATPGMRPIQKGSCPTAREAVSNISTPSAVWASTAGASGFPSTEGIVLSNGDGYVLDGRFAARLRASECRAQSSALLALRLRLNRTSLARLQSEQRLRPRGQLQGGSGQHWCRRREG